LTIEISFFGDHRTRLGESPLWDAQAGRLWWVDSVAGAIHAASEDGERQIDRRYDSMIGSIGFADHGLIAGFADHFALIDGTTGQATPLATVPGHDGSMRLNDGKVDRSGRHYICGQTRQRDDATGTLFRLSTAGALDPIACDMRISNAICFSVDGRRLYFADSLDGTIRCHDYDPATGAVGARVATIDLTPIGKAPDGATVDANGNIWVALVLDQAIACISPRGDLIARIESPIPFPSCPAFGGANLDTLYVTSIANSGHMLVTDHPDGGRILAIRGLGVRGVPEQRFAAGGRHGDRDAI
jgi:sugar lactone lactonase YvrE